MVTAPVEPDASAAMVQAAINPGELVGDATSEVKYQVLPNTLVFTRVVQNATAVLPFKRQRTEKERFPQVVGGGFDPAFPLYVLGVAYEGIPTTAAAMHWPNERGRLVAQITGTCTIVVHTEDLDDLEILDKLAIDRNRDNLSKQISMVKNYNLPKIKKFDNSENDKKKQLLDTFLTKSEIEIIESSGVELKNVTKSGGTEKLEDFMNEAGYKELVDRNSTKKDDDLVMFLKEVRRMVLAEMSPFGILLEKGHESARILLTPA